MTTPSTRTTPNRPSIHASDSPQQRVPAPPPLVKLRLAQTGTIALRGPSSGRIYLFSDREAITVLAQDVDALLRTGALERAR